MAGFMGTKRQKNQLELAFTDEARSEAPSANGEGTEVPVAERRSENPATQEQWLEAICARENCKRALRQVKANRGAAGVDGMRVDQLPEYLVQHWPAIREQLYAGTYRPQPVRRVEIPKPDGGMRKLGIPTVLDRFLQQMVMQTLQSSWDGTFSENSYGFRPGRSAHQAVEQAQRHIAAGYGWVVDIDLEKFFDRVNHHRLMDAIAQRVGDKRLLKLIRVWLHAGVLENGLVSPTTEGTPQGGPLSPLLSNLVLDELDRELQRRGHRFVRYADDCNIYVRSRFAAQRVMATITRFIERRLKLRVNREKSAVARPRERKFLGFSFPGGAAPKRRLAPKTVLRFKSRVRELTRRTRGISLVQMVKELSGYLQGWHSYFGFCQTPSVLNKLEKWIRHRLRATAWKLWKRSPVRFRELQRRNVDRELTQQTVGSSHGPWRLSNSPAMSLALPLAYFTALGLPRLTACA